MRDCLLIFIAGGLGSLLRFLFVKGTSDFIQYPYGTMTVNVIGCFIIGLLYVFCKKDTLTFNQYLILSVGFCGGFTTFSAFIHENMDLFSQKQFLKAFVYTCLSFIIGVLANFAGIKVGEIL